MSKEYSETLGKNIRYLEVLGKNIRYKKEHIRDDLYRLYIKKNEIELLENYLTELEQIKNANPSEAMDSLEEIISYYNEPQYELGGGYSYKNELLESCGNEVNTIKQALVKAQEQEKEIDRLENQCLDLLGDNIRFKKLLEIIKEKKVNVYTEIMLCDTYEEYLNLGYILLNICPKLTHEEFDLLKRWSNGK